MKKKGFQMNAKFMDFYNNAKNRGNGYGIFLLNNVLSYNEPGTKTSALNRDEINEFSKILPSFESSRENLIGIHAVTRGENELCFFKVINTQKLKNEGDWLFVCLSKTADSDPKLLYKIKYMDLRSLKLRLETHCFNDIERCISLIQDWDANI